MEIEELKLKFDELIASLDNPKTQNILKEAEYDIEKLNTVIKNYLENIELINPKDISIIKAKISEMIQLTKRGLEPHAINEFISTSNFVINKTPMNIKPKINETSLEREITEEEFTKRFNSWLNLLNSKLEKKSNFILLVDNIEYEFYKTGENNVLFIKVRKGKELFSPEYINLIELINIVFKGEEGNSEMAKNIATKIKDKSIFDYFIPNDSFSELYETINNRLLKQENELINLQKENQSLDNKKIEFYEIFEKAKTIDEKCESTISAAEKRAELGASISYWQKKQEKHKKEFWKFAIIAIFLISALVLILIYFLNSHSQENKITEGIKNEIISEIINKIDKKLEKEKTVKSDENNKLNEKKDTKTEPKELKVEKEGKDNKSLSIDVNVQIEKVTQTYKEELTADSKETSEKKDDNSFLKDFENSNLPWYFLMIFASSSAFWIIRITVKIALSNLHLSEDAYERVVMIQTYLAFVKETEVKEKDKELILSSLFRPSNIGIIQDESSVTVSDIITAFKK